MGRLIVFVISFFCGVNAHAEDIPKNHFDIVGLTTSVNYLHGKDTKDFYPGVNVSPEIRYRYGRDDGFQTTFAVGWVGINALSNSKDGQQQLPERASYRTQELYAVIGFAVSIGGAGSESAVKRFGCGIGWANLKIGKAPDKYDSGAVAMCGLSTNGLFTWSK